MAGCRLLITLDYSYVVWQNGTRAEYGCREGYRHHSGDLVRTCINSTWSGLPPACAVDSVLPKAYLVLLIIGVTMSVFLASIPYDFYRFRRRRKAVRKHQERLSLMTRIAPGHAKMTTQTLALGANPPSAAQRRFGFRSIIKAFRFVTDKMKTNNEDDTESGLSGRTVDAPAGANGVPVSGQHPGGSHHVPKSPKLAETRAARDRMSAVLQMWSGGRSTRAKSLDISGDVAVSRHLLRNKRRNSLVTASNSAIQAAATTAATAAAAATAFHGSTDIPDTHYPDTRYDTDLHDAGFRRQEDRTQVTYLSTPESCPTQSTAAGSFSREAHPPVGSGRYVQLAASIPEGADEDDDGTFVGCKFEITGRGRLTASSSVPCPDKVATHMSVSQDIPRQHSSLEISRAAPPDCSPRSSGQPGHFLGPSNRSPRSQHNRKSRSLHRQRTQEIDDTSPIEQQSRYSYHTQYSQSDY